MNNEDPIKLLAVEDEPFLRDLLLMKFNKEGILATYADNGNTALQMAKKEQPDVILLDLVLPDMSGFEILATLKEQEETKNIPVIVLSNLGQDSDIARCKEGGAVEVLIKAHSSPSEILKHVREVVATKK